MSPPERDHGELDSIERSPAESPDHLDVSVAGADEQKLFHLVRRYRVVRSIRVAPAVAIATLILASCAEPQAAAEDERPLTERCEAEIVELHQWIEEWSNAELPNTPEAFKRFDQVIAPSFVIIDPDGELIERQPIIEALRGAHGRWQGAAGRISIDGYRLHQTGDGLALATYVEWHDLPSGRVGRLSSVLFGTNAQAPNGLEWLHLHEVWVPGFAPSSGAEAAIDGP